MAIVKVESTASLSKSVLNIIIGSDEAINPIDESGREYEGIGSSLSSNAFGFRAFLENLDTDNITSSSPTKLVYVDAGSDGGGYTYKDTLILTGNQLPINLQPGFNVNTFVSNISDSYTEKQVLNNVITYSGVYTGVFDVYVNPTNIAAGMVGRTSTEKNSGFYLDESLGKVTFSENISSTGDINVDLSGPLDFSNQASGVVTKLSYSASESATGYSASEKFSFTSDSFEFDNNNVYSGTVTNLNFSGAIKQGSFSAGYSYAATGNNDLLADAVSAYAAGEGSLDDITAALLFGNDVITGLDVAGEGDFLFAYDGNDKVDGLKGDDFVDGGNGNDTLSGGDGNDALNGNAGNDSISGGNNDDFLEGEVGKDTIKGDAGNDTIVGGTGADILTGGLGNDRFEFNAKTASTVSDSGISTLTMDRVLDFKTGLDTVYIDLNRLVDATLVESTTVAKNFGQALAVANSYFSTDLNNTDNAYFGYDATNGYVFVDADNNGVADMAITLVGINNGAKISAADITFIDSTIIL